MNYKSNIHKQITVGLLAIIALGTVLYYFIPDFPEQARHQVLALALLIITVPLGSAITLVVYDRYSDEDFIKGYKSTRPFINVKTANLQNTLEQTVVCALTITPLSLLTPPSLLKMSLIQAIIFLVGRAIYFIGYSLNPEHRFVGFVVGWYIQGISFFTSLYFSLSLFGMLG